MKSTLALIIAGIAATSAAHGTTINYTFNNLTYNGALASAAIQGSGATASGSVAVTKFSSTAAGITDGWVLTHLQALGYNPVSLNSYSASLTQVDFVFGGTFGGTTTAGITGASGMGSATAYDSVRNTVKGNASFQAPGTSATNLAQVASAASGTFLLRNNSTLAPGTDTSLNPYSASNLNFATSSLTLINGLSAYEGSGQYQIAVTASNVSSAQGTKVCANCTLTSTNSATSMNAKVTPTYTYSLNVSFEEASQVPEPSTLFLTGSVLLGASQWIRRRRA